MGLLHEEIIMKGYSLIPRPSVHSDHSAGLIRAGLRD